MVTCNLRWTVGNALSGKCREIGSVVVMKIAILSKSDSFGGGASRVATELAKGLEDKGYKVHHYTSWLGGDKHNFSRNLYPRGLQNVFRATHTLSMLAGFPEILPLEYITLRKKLLDYDIVHFHDISSAISPHTVNWVSRLRPTFWTVHDCSPFTGGCLYPMECEKFQNRCHKCPQLGEWPIKAFADFTGFMQSIKRNISEGGLVNYIAPSQWMSDMALSSGMFAEAPHVIPNGVDVNIFRPVQKEAVRRKLSLPSDRKIILLSAGSILDRRKGSRFAIEALHRIKDINPFLLVIGNMGGEAHSLFSEFDYHSTGYIGNTELMANYYAAADIFLFCSLADNMPLVILETMASGVPTVGFATGGAPDMVTHNESGYLVQQKDVAGLEKGLRAAFADKTYLQWGKAARGLADSMFSQEVFIEKHLSFYRDKIDMVCR